MEKYLKVIKENKLSLIASLFVVTATVLLTFGQSWFGHRYKVTKSYAEKNFVYEEKFEMKNVPSGVILWKHGVKEYPLDVDSPDSTQYYKFYDIGIFDAENGVVYRVRVPFYAYLLFWGEKIDTKKFRRKNSFPKKLPPKKQENKIEDYKLILL